MSVTSTTDIIELNLNNKNIRGVLDLTHYGKLQKLICSENEIVGFVNIPPTLLVLDCSNNNIGGWIGGGDNLPPTLQKLYCYNNNIRGISNIPPTLTELYCWNNQIEGVIADLPPALEMFDCYNNRITRLPTILPSTLKYLYCDKNPLVYGFEPTLKNITRWNTFIRFYQSTKIYNTVKNNFLHRKLVAFYHPDNIQRYWNEALGGLDETSFISYY